MTRVGLAVKVLFAYYGMPDELWPALSQGLLQCQFDRAGQLRIMFTNKVIEIFLLRRQLQAERKENEQLKDDLRRADDFFYEKERDMGGSLWKTYPSCD